MKTNRFAILSSLVLCLLLPSCATRKKIVVPDGKPNFAGMWLYNYELSDNSRQKVREVLGSEGADVGDIKDDRKEQIRRRIQTIIDAPELLRVEYMKGSMLVAGGNGFRRRYDLSGTVEKLAPMQITTFWDGEVLINEMEGEKAKITETYQLAPDRRQLLMTLTYKADRFDQPIVVHRVYDRE